jgi:predicted ATPase
LTVIVGTNASGKSNLRDAFRFIHGMSRGYSLAEIIGEKYVEGGVLQWKGIRGGTQETASFGKNQFSIRTRLGSAAIDHDDELLSAFLDSHSHRIDVGLADRKAGPLVIREKLSEHSTPVFDSHPWDDPPAQEEQEYVFVRLPRDEQNRKHGKRIRFLATTPVVSQLPHKKDVPARYRRPASRFVEELQSMRFLDLSPDAMRLPSIPGQTILGDRGENLSSVLQAICNDLSLKNALSEWIRELTPIDVVDFEFVPDQAGRVLVSLVESSGQKTSAYSASDGTLRFLAIIAALMGPDSARFYFLEEIDNGIHPTRLGLLLQLIEQHTRQGKVQIVATTHSPQLLAMLSEDARQHAVLVYRLEHEAEARIQRIMSIPSVREVLERQNLSRLHESGWLENVMKYTRHSGRFSERPIRACPDRESHSSGSREAACSRGDLQRSTARRGRERAKLG